MKHFSKYFVILAVLAMLVSACGQAAEEPASLYDRIMEEGKMVVGTSADYPPYESIAEDGSYVGFDMDLIREMGDRMGIEIEIVDMGFDALVTAVQEGKLDAVIASMAPTPERAEKVDFTIAYYIGEQSFLAAGDSDITLTDPLEAASYKIGIQTGTTLEEWVTTNLVDAGLMEDANVFRYERADNAALDLQAGRIDLVLLDQGPAEALADNMGLQVIYTAPIIETVETAIALPKGETELKAALDATITELLEEGYIDELILEWLVAGE
jgi:polar amino acid transport system substrate-binding protein